MLELEPDADAIHAADKIIQRGVDVNAGIGLRCRGSVPVEQRQAEVIGVEALAAEQLPVRRCARSDAGALGRDRARQAVLVV